MKCFKNACFCVEWFGLHVDCMFTAFGFVREKKQSVFFTTEAVYFCEEKNIVCSIVFQSEWDSFWYFECLFAGDKALKDQRIFLPFKTTFN